MKREFSRLGVRKLYVPDFYDGAHTNGPGVLFASVFSTALKDAKEFKVVSREHAHRFLLRNQWTDCDLIKPEVLGKFSAEFNIDAILNGTLVPANSSFSMNFVLHDLLAESSDELQ